MSNFDDPVWLAEQAREAVLVLQLWAGQVFGVGGALASIQAWLRTYEATPAGERAALVEVFMTQVIEPYLEVSDSAWALEGQQRERDWREWQRLTDGTERPV